MPLQSRGTQLVQLCKGAALSLASSWLTLCGYTFGMQAHVCSPAKLQHHSSAALITKQAGGDQKTLSQQCTAGHIIDTNALLLSPMLGDQQCSGTKLLQTLP